MIDKVIPVQEVYKQYQKYKGFAHNLLYRYTSKLDIHEDLDSYLYEWIYHAFNLHDNLRSNIGTYIYITIKRNIHRFIDSYSKLYNKEVPVDFISDTDGKIDNRLDTNVDYYILRNLLEKHISVLPPRDQSVIKMYFGICPYKKLTMDKIANLLNVTKTVVFVIIHRSLKKLKGHMNNIDKEGFLDE